MHDVLKYIKIDNSQYTQGINAIRIIPEANNVKRYELVRAIRDIIRITEMFLDDNKKTSFIENFKIKLGREYIYEIENLGVNLHFLELKFI